MKKNIIKWLAIPLIILLLIFIIPAMHNQFNGAYESLNSTDQAVLTELNQYIEAERKSPIWKDYDLANKPILALNGSIGKAYLVNAASEVQSLFAKEIKMPENYSIRVYRISAAAPMLLQFIPISNFNLLGKTYPVFGNDVYFTKYNEDESIKAKQSSKHYITFLSHEAFHYYMQNNWPEGGRFDTSTLTNKDLDLMENQYVIFAKIYDALNSEAPDRNMLLSLAAEYVASEEARFQQNAEYMNEESLAETAEGSAMYIGIHASEAVNYDYRIMYYFDERVSDGIIEWPFDNVVPLIKSGQLDKSMIASDWVYQTGALLCELIDTLDVPNWQQKLNTQTKDSPVTLYSLLSDYTKSTPPAE